MRHMYQLRDVEAPFRVGGGFRDELVATAMALSLVVFGSFVAVEVLFGEQRPVASEVLVAAENDPQTLGVTDVPPERIDLVPSPTPEPVAPAPVIEMATKSAVASEGAVVAPVVPFGEDGAYDFSAYAISFSRPRLTFDPVRQTGRKFVVEVKLVNKTVMDGLDMRIFASIVKDGSILVPKAVMHVPNRQLVAVNQEVLFQAEITLIDATDVRELRFEPGSDIPIASHFLYP